MPFPCFLLPSKALAMIQRLACHLFKHKAIIWASHISCTPKKQLQNRLMSTIFSNLGLCAVCWARSMCHHKLWPTSVNHPFSSLNNSLGFAGGKHYQKITIPLFRLVLQNFAIPGYFPYILFYSYLFSLLSSGGFVIAVCGSISVREVVKH